MKKDDMEFGSHGCSYTPFGRIELKFLKTELESSKQIIESELGYECKYFALPFWSSDDYDEKTIESVEETGFEKCYLNNHGYDRFDANPFLLNRIVMNNENNYKFILGWWRWKQ